MRIIQLLAVAACASLSWLGSARATPEYPSVIDAKLGVSCGEPRKRCLICHTTARGGQGTAEQPFVRNLKLEDGHRPAALIAALDALLLDGERDSDDDGEFDEEELRSCGNPSGDDLGNVVYGCDGAQLAPPASPSPVLACLALGLAALLVRSRRR
jgi:hypothetical protein